MKNLDPNHVKLKPDEKIIDQRPGKSGFADLTALTSEGRILAAEYAEISGQWQYTWIDITPEMETLETQSRNPTGSAQFHCACGPGCDGSDFEC